MLQANARRLLVGVVKKIWSTHGEEVERSKENQVDFDRPDFIWHYLLQSFATMGRASAWHGLMGEPANYSRVTYEALAELSAEMRAAQVLAVCQAAKLRMPTKKASYILGSFSVLQRLGGHAGARKALDGRQGREAIKQFLMKFPGIGEKYARNIMMDVYHEDFRNSIAIDARIKSITNAMGLSFGTDYASEEQFYLGVAEDAGLNGWELDRLMFGQRDAVLAGLKAAMETPG